MGRKKKCETWLPAQTLRIKAFAREFAANVLNERHGQKFSITDVQIALSKRAESLAITDQTLRNWMSGEDSPNATFLKWIGREWSGCTDWLEPDIESSPIRRFLCALDMWGSPIDGPIRILDTTSADITVGKGLAILAKRWAPSSVPGHLCEYVIPRLNRNVPRHVPNTVYQSFNPLTLMDFMFRCGPYIEFSEDEFAEWAIDFASLTLMIGAIFEGASLEKRDLSGRTGEFNWLTHRIFFIAHGNWPNLESVRGELQNFFEFEDSAINRYSHRLMRAREILNKELLCIGSDLSIVKELSGRIKERSKMWQVPLGVHSETLE
ncbi:MAG: hypothetical protein C0406_10380 [Sideroxydans sp.]|nr:hypothetical protein [Sideroxydans sp.]